MTNTNELLTVAHAAKAAGLSNIPKQTVSSWIHRGKGGVNMPTVQIDGYHFITVEGFKAWMGEVNSNDRFTVSRQEK